MAFLRCSKCGSDAGFLIETQDRRILEVKRLALDRVVKSVLVTCTYCNNRWDHVPVSLKDNSLEQRFQAKQDKKLEVGTRSL
jgi:predicted molibdopterin-dependent oxidoreductase YjgC